MTLIYSLILGKSTELASSQAVRFIIVEVLYSRTPTATDPQRRNDAPSPEHLGSQSGRGPQSQICYQLPKRSEGKWVKIKFPLRFLHENLSRNIHKFLVFLPNPAKISGNILHFSSKYSMPTPIFIQVFLKISHK